MRITLNRSETIRIGTAGEASARAYVGEPTVPYGHSRDREQAFAKVEAQNLGRISHGSERGLLVPAQEKIDVDANLIAEQRACADSVRSKSPFDRFVRELFHDYILHV